MDIICCYYCNKPAVSLDHSWPWLQDATVCKEHHKKLDLIWKGIRKANKKGICKTCNQVIEKGQSIVGEKKERHHLSCNDWIKK